MKTLIALMVLINTTFVFAQRVHCIDLKNIWEVSFNLLEDEANEIQFIKNGEVFKEFNNKKIDKAIMRSPFSNRGLITYEVALEKAMYLSFERHFIGKVIENSFHATFLLSSNPLQFEKHVDCAVLAN